MTEKKKGTTVPTGKHELDLTEKERAASGRKLAKAVAERERLEAELEAEKQKAKDATKSLRERVAKAKEEESRIAREVNTGKRLVNAQQELLEE